MGIIFAKSLQSVNYDTEIVQDGQIAMARLAEVAPAIVILDMHLPHVLGTDILKHIRATPHLAHSRIITATADALLASTVQEKSDLVLLTINIYQLRDLAASLRP